MQEYSINIDGELITFDRPQIMGILNVTPDSFFSRSRCQDSDAIRRRIHQFETDGADIIDIGGYSTRPGATVISSEEEFHRLSQGIEIIKKEVPNMIISIDTFRADVARKCVENYGGMIINDVSGGTIDVNMFSTVAELKVPYILMHMRGTPATMNTLTEYDNLIVDVIRDLAQKVSQLTLLGVNDIIIDPGFGFSKTVEQNYELMNHLEEFKILDLPILVGISRKSMIYRALNLTPESSLTGTIALNMVSLMNGASILRVHDVKEAKETLGIYNMLIKNQ